MPFSSCIQTIEDVLSTLTPPPYTVDVSIVLQSVRVRHDTGLDRETIELAIENAGFDIESPIPRDSTAATKQTSNFLSGRQSKHIAQCSLCQSGEAYAHAVPHLSALGEIPEVSESPVEEQGPVTLSLSIEGMTCVACSNTITRLLSEADGVSDVVVDFLSHSARLVVESQKLIPVVIETIEDAGFNAEVVKAESLVKVPTQETTTRTICLKVDGMSHCQ